MPCKSVLFFQIHRREEETGFEPSLSDPTAPPCFPLHRGSDSQPQGERGHEAILSVGALFLSRCDFNSPLHVVSVWVVFTP